MKQLIRRYFLTNHQEVKAAPLFAVLALLFGGAFIVVTPLFWGADEAFHIARIYQLSSGQLLADKQQHNRAESGYGGLIPDSVYNGMQITVHDLTVNGAGTYKYGVQQVDTPEVYETLAKQPLENGHTVRFGFPATAAYSPIPYAPAIGSMAIARVLDFDVGSTVWFMRAAVLLSFVAIVYIALRQLEAFRIKWLFFVIALLPTTIGSAAIVTADALTNAWALLFTAMIFKVWLSRHTLEFSWWQSALLVVSAFGIGLQKPGYIPLLLLFLLVPTRLFAPRLAYGRLLKYGSFIIILALVGCWSLLTRDLAHAAGLIRPDDNWIYINASQQVAHMIAQPFSFLISFMRTFLLFDMKFFMGMVATMGLNLVLAPGISILMVIISTVLAVLSAEKLVVSKKVQALGWLLALASVMIICAGMYITFSAVKALDIAGTQGRYFIPLLPLLLGLGAIAVTKYVTPSRSLQRVAPYIIVAATFISLSAALVKYTYITWG